MGLGKDETAKGSCQDQGGSLSGLGITTVRHRYGSGWHQNCETSDFPARVVAYGKDSSCGRNWIERLITGRDLDRQAQQR